MAQSTPPPYPTATSSVTQVTTFSHVTPASGPPPPPNLPVDAPGQQFGDAPVVMICPQCQNRIVTSLAYVRGTMVYAASFFLLVSIIPWLLCACFIPLCLRSMKDVEHRCPSCHTVLGTYTRLT